jgi:hypothetical protein
MNAETLLTPSRELKKHSHDLQQDAELVVKDVKNQTSAGLQEIKREANMRLQEAKGNISNLYDSLKDFTAAHPLSIFGVGLVTGIVLAAWRRK